MLDTKGEVVIINKDMLPNLKIGRTLDDGAIIHTYECFDQVFADGASVLDQPPREYLELGIITQGVGVHSIDGNIVPCKVGDVYIVPPGVRHAYFTASNSERLVVRKLVFRTQDWFHGEVAQRGSKRYCYGVFSDGGAVAYAMLSANINERINGILDGIESELSDREDEWRNVVLSFLVQIFSFLSRYINRSLKNSFRKAKDWEIASHAMKIVEDEFSNHELSLDGIAARMFVSPSKLSRVFKAESGQLFSEYVRDVRLNYAAKLLKETELSVEKIIYECGIYGVSSFYRNFREVFGMTPQIYKQIEESKKETNKITAKFLKSMIEYEELEKNKDTSYHLSSVFFSELA